MRKARQIRKYLFRFMPGCGAVYQRRSDNRPRSYSGEMRNEIRASGTNKACSDHKTNHRFQQSGTLSSTGWLRRLRIRPCALRADAGLATPTWRHLLDECRRKTDIATPACSIETPACCNSTVIRLAAKRTTKSGLRDDIGHPTPLSHRSGTGETPARYRVATAIPTDGPHAPRWSNESPCGTRKSRPRHSCGSLDLRC